jgi:hypothetical protein
VWVLSALRSRARTSFIFAEPSNFGFDRTSNKTDAEADLLALVDGQATVCGVKSSWRGLRSVDIQDFVALSRRLRPDIALLAVMEKGSGPAELVDAKSQLSAEGIEYELLTPEIFSVPDDPMLRAYGDN